MNTATHVRNFVENLKKKNFEKAKSLIEEAIGKMAHSKQLNCSIDDSIVLDGAYREDIIEWIKSFEYDVEEVNDIQAPNHFIKISCPNSQKTNKTMGIIQQNLEKFLSVGENTIVSNGSFQVADFNNLRKILEGTKEDFLIFDNSGGAAFEVVFDRKSADKNLYYVKDFIAYLLAEHKSWIFCYQLDEEQFILKEL